jgi:transposase
MEPRRGKISEYDKNKGTEGLPVVRPNVAGIDVGSKTHWVCAPKLDGEGRDVEEFKATTPGLEKMAEWLKQRKVESVAMESTGVYWIAPHEILERHGVDVVLVSTKEFVNVPGRKKTDRVDCKWIQRLHSCGLLCGSFRPKEQICMIRTLVRDKGESDSRAERLVATNAEKVWTK